MTPSPPEMPRAPQPSLRPSVEGKNGHGLQASLPSASLHEGADLTDPIDAAAALWLARQREGLSASGQTELQSWLATDPRHAAAFAALQGTLERLQALPRPQQQALVDGVPAAAPARRALPAVGPWARRPRGRDVLPSAAGTVAVLVMCTALWTGWDHLRQQPTFDQHHATGQGQQRTLRLPDGTQVLLDTQTQAHVRLFRNRREVHLRRGQALFTVQPDADRPFHVMAGAVRLTVVGTRFVVRHAAGGIAPDTTVVTVEEGRVRVAGARSNDEPGALAESVRELTVGQEVTANAQGQLSPVGPAALAHAGAWRSGRVSFDNTPLVQALAEFERYAPTHLVVGDPAVGLMRVGGSYDVRKVHAFAQALPEVLPVRLQKVPGGTAIVPR